REVSGYRASRGKRHHTLDRQPLLCDEGLEERNERDVRDELAESHARGEDQGDRLESGEVQPRLEKSRLVYTLHEDKHRSEEDQRRPVDSTHDGCALTAEDHHRQCPCDCDERKWDERRACKDPNANEHENDRKRHTGERCKPLVTDLALRFVVCALDCTHGGKSGKKQVGDHEVDDGWDAKVEEKREERLGHLAV